MDQSPSNSTDTTRDQLSAQAQSVLLTLNPRPLWNHMDRLGKIPRPSFHTEGVQQYIRELAQSNDKNIRQDSRGNIVVSIPGKGRGIGKPALILQGHDDMVPIAAKGVKHDFLQDPIEFELREESLDGQTVRVAGTRESRTTAGFDNAIGLAGALCFIDNDTLENHPPLEILCTVDEEVGLDGAKEMDPSLLQGDYLINLDTEDENEIYISSAGSRDATMSWDLRRGPVPEGCVPIQISISELPGGHSGVEIDDKRGNAIGLLARIIPEIMRDEEIGVVSIDGGERRNAIAANANAILWAKKDRSREIMQRIFKSMGSLTETSFLCGELLSTVPSTLNLSIGVRTLNGKFSGPIDSNQITDLLYMFQELPAGPLAFSSAVPGLVETSNNVALVSTKEDKLSVVCMTRSSKSGAVEEAQAKFEKLTRDLGGEIAYENVSPGWEADPHNPLLSLAKVVFTEVYGVEPKIKAVHAGLECGAFKQKKPSLNIISFGPTIKGAHTNKEFVVVDSVERFFKALLRTVESCCELPEVK